MIDKKLMSYFGYGFEKRFVESLLAIILSLFVLFSCSRQVLAPLDAEDEFARGKSYFDNKKYEKAIQSFEKVIFYYPSSEYVDDAQYWLAQSYFEDKQYDLAITEYDYLVRNFPGSAFLPQGYFYRAKTHYLKAPSFDKDQTELMAAIAMLDDFLTAFPNSSYTNDVRELILKGRNRLAKKELESGKLYIKLGDRDAALIYFDYVIANYSETESCNEAKYYTATVYEKQHKTDEALKIYQELLADNTWQKKAEAKIKEIEKKEPK